MGQKSKPPEGSAFSKTFPEIYSLWGSTIRQYEKPTGGTFGTKIIALANFSIQLCIQVHMMRRGFAYSRYGSGSNQIYKSERNLHMCMHLL